MWVTWRDNSSPPTRHLVHNFLEDQVIVRHGCQSFQMLMSLTSVGVQDRSTSPSTHLGSVVLLCCWACRRLDSSRDSICSWHARKQSWKQTRQHWVNTITLLNINREQSMTFSTFKYGFGRMFVCIPGHCEWPVTRSWWGSGRTRRHLGSLDRDLEQLPLRCPLPPWMEDWRWSWHLRKRHKHVLQHRTSTAQFGSHYKTLYPLSFQWMNRTVHACSLEFLICIPEMPCS